MKPFMDQDFLLENDVAKKLYHEYAENMPIFDYHCHISPRMIYENHQFENIGLPMQYLRLAAKASHLSCQLASPRMNFSSTPLESITRHL